MQLLSCFILMLLLLLRVLLHHSSTLPHLRILGSATVPVAIAIVLSKSLVAIAACSRGLTIQRAELAFSKTRFS